MVRVHSLANNVTTSWACGSTWMMARLPTVCHFFWRGPPHPSSSRTLDRDVDPESASSAITTSSLLVVESVCLKEVYYYYLVEMLCCNDVRSPRTYAVMVGLPGPPTHTVPCRSLPRQI